LLPALLRVLLPVLLLLWRTLWCALCLAMRTSESSRQAMVAGMHCIISTAVGSTAQHDTMVSSTTKTVSMIGTTCEQVRDWGPFNPITTHVVAAPEQRQHAQQQACAPKSTTVWPTHV
jgi:hypothetical protein